MNVTGTGDLDGNFTGILDFDADGTATIATTKNLAGAVTTSAGDNTGIGQQVGAQASPVAASTGPGDRRDELRPEAVRLGELLRRGDPVAKILSYTPYVSESQG